MIFEVAIPVRLELWGTGDVGGAIGSVTDQLVMIGEDAPELLDYDVSSEADDHAVSIELTVDAEDAVAALATAVNWALSAIHAVSGNAQGWTVCSVESVSVQMLAVPLS